MIFNLTEKQYVWLINISLVSACLILCMIILADVRLNVISEVFIEHLVAISIAISKLTYEAQGLIGFESVLEILKKIPNISSLSLDSINSYDNYQLVINQVLHEATLIENINRNDIHAFANDLGYLYYAIAAFFIFGIKIQSLTYLWLSILFISVLFYVLAFRRNISLLLLLWCLIVAISIVVIALPGVGNQLLTIHNQRFFPVLGLIALFHMIFYQNNGKLGDFFLMFLQAMILVFVIMTRGSAQWMLIALVLSSLYMLFRFKKNEEVTNGVVSFLKSLIPKLSPVIIVFMLFVSSKLFVVDLLHDEYDKPEWATSHAVWYAAVIGLTTDPSLYKQYVCTDEPLEDRLTGFRPLLCKDSTRRYTKPRLFYGIIDQPSDMHAYHAAVKYLRDNGSSEQLGSDKKNSVYISINWSRFDEIMRKVYLKMISERPLDVLYMHIIVKPLKYLKESAMYLVYIWKSIMNSERLISLFLILIITCLFYSFHLAGYRKLKFEKKDTFSESNESGTLYYFGIVLISSLALSILLYSQAHTIPDSLIVVITFFMYFFLTKSEKLMGLIKQARSWKNIN